MGYLIAFIEFVNIGSSFQKSYKKVNALFK